MKRKGWVSSLGWLAGDREVARDVQIPSVEDAKRIERERKYLVEERISIVGRIKRLLALHGIWLTGKRIGRGLRERLDTLATGDGAFTHLPAVDNPPRNFGLSR